MLEKIKYDTISYMEKEIDSKTSTSNNQQPAQAKPAKQPAPEFFGHTEGQDIWTSFLTEKMFAHRGLWDKDTPENSLSAFKKAIDAGYGIELDVSPIEDGTPVIFHDTKMSRMTGKDKYIQNLTKEELATTTLLSTTETIPTLEQVLKLVDGKVPLLIEIKSQEKIGDLEKRVLELLKTYKGEYAVQSFNPYTLKWFYQNAPKIWRGQLASYFKGVRLSLVKKLVLRRLGMKKSTHQNFVSYDIDNLPNIWTKKLEIPLLSWTIRSQKDYVKAIQYSDNVIFENYIPKI